MVSNDNGTDTSASAALVVLAGVPPVITSNPHDTTVCVTATSAHFSVSVDTPASMPTFSYTWFESPDGGTTWDSVVSSDFDLADLTGYNSATLTMASGYLLLHDGYMYEVVVGTDSGMTLSSAATLHIDLPDAGTITGPTAVCLGSTITLSSTIAGGLWSSNNMAIGTVGSMSGILGGIAPGTDTVLYQITNTCGNVSTAAFISVDTVLIGQPISGPWATCIGHIIDLTDTVSGGTWSSSGVYAYVNASGMVEGISAGFEVVHYIIIDACNSVDETYGIEVDAPIDPGTITGPSTVCAGSWISFSSTVGDGTWLSSNSAVAIVDGSGNVTGVSDGVAIISYYFSNACGATAATDTVHVSAMASSIGGIDSVGIGFTQLLTDSAAGGVWVSSDTTIAKIDSATGLVTGIAGGSVIISYTVSNTCGTTTASIILQVGVASSSTILGFDSVCVGQTLLLSDAVGGGVWSTAPGSGASVNDTGLVTGISVGWANITYTLTNGFGSASAVKSVWVAHNLVDSLHVPNIFALGGSYTFVGFPTGGTWTSSNTSVGNFIGTPGFFVIYGHGTTTITYSVPTLCGTADTTFVIDLSSSHVGVNEINGNVSVLNVYPNPSTGNFTVNLASGVTEQAVVTVTNIVGEKVKEFTIATNQLAELSLDQPDGVYFISTETSTGKYSAKITITR